MFSLQLVWKHAMVQILSHGPMPAPAQAILRGESSDVSLTFSLWESGERKGLV